MSDLSLCAEEVAVPSAQPWAPSREVRDLPGPRAVSDLLAGSTAFCMHVQPVIELRTGRAWGVEALARFPGHPRPGPDAWFSSAGRDGRGIALEELTLRAALDLLPRLPAGLRMTVNLSARALLRPSVQLLLLGEPDTRLVIELTEHEQVADYPALLGALTACRAGGIGLGIDDFGAGHSSLRHVLHLDPDVLKLDLTLVQGVAACARRQALVEAMLGFCRRTGAMLVAEGVETGADLQALAGLGVEHAQGYALGRPGLPDEVLPRLSGAPSPVVVLP